MNTRRYGIDVQAYSEDVFVDLAGRFEAPNAHNRWDAPLHTVHPSTTGNLASDLQPVVIGLTSRTTDGPSIGPNAVVSKELIPNLATISSSLSQTNLLYELDNAAQVCVLTTFTAQYLSGSVSENGLV